ncbi:MAG: phosphoribosylamine--glycine ligase [Jatrophihabitantaceae bacterium]
MAGDPIVTALLCAPGNAGTAAIAEQRPVDSLDPAAVAALAAGWRAELVIIGPEAPLVAGVADAVREAGIACFGPSRAAAALEGSKAFAKDVMAAAGVPTAAARLCATPEQAAAALAEFGPPYVVKDDGLAAGKGVLVTEDRDAALAHAAACGRVLIEQYLDGPEVSLFCVTDGATVRALLPAQDYKRLGDGDAGPNTGGMGAYAPLDWLPDGFVDEVIADIAQPTIAELSRRGIPFAGLLYVGLALTAQGLRVVEFNARFGDPETQVVLALLDSSLAELLHAAATGSLADQPSPRWRAGAAVTVVIAAANYPATPRTDDAIAGGDQPGVIHAGTRRDGDGVLRSTGGRVLSATAIGEDLVQARTAAYRLVDSIELAGSQHRRDIAAGR